MKLYYAPGACSLADHIALLEAGLDFELERVDLKRKTTVSGANYTAINAKGYVPALVLDDGEIVTENIAVLDWIAARHPAIGLGGPLGRMRLLEALAYISTEIHKGFKPFFAGGGTEEKTRAQALIIQRLQWFVDGMRKPYLFGSEPTVADFYLFVTLRWAANFSIVVPEPLAELRERMLTRPNVRAAIDFEEGAAQRTGSV